MFAYIAHVWVVLFSFAILFFLRYLRRGKARNGYFGHAIIGLLGRNNNIILIIALSVFLILMTLRGNVTTYLLCGFLFRWACIKRQPSTWLPLIKFLEHLRLLGWPPGHTGQTRFLNGEMPGWCFGYVRDIYAEKGQYRKGANHLW